jgi:hypothetical protein
MRSTDAIEHLLTARKPENAVEIFRSYLKDLGFENLLVGHHDLSHIAIGPEGWGTYYFDQGFPTFDPVLRAARIIKRPHTWEEVCRDIPASELKFMEECKKAGLQNGLSVPIHDKNGLRVNISVSARDHGAEVVRTPVQ